MPPWQVKTERGELVAQCATQREAVDAAEEAARRDGGGELVIHAADAHVEARREISPSR
jgi:hypothetical protein